MKKLLCILAATSMVMSTPASAMATQTNTSQTDLSDPFQLRENTFASVKGTIMGMTQGDLIMISVEDEKGTRYEFVVTPDTYIFKDTALFMDEEVIVFYDITVPTTDIYPSRQNAVVIAPADMGIETVYVSYFDENLLSADNNFIIRSTENAEIINTDGTKFTGDIKNKNLAVVFSIATLSLPGQIAPSKIIVLPGSTDSNEPYTPSVDVSKMPIIVNGAPVSGPSAYTNEEGIVMVPLRVIAEALGYDVVWEEETQSVRIGIAMSLQIGKDYYVYARMAPIELGTAPELKDGITYVPLTFFKEVAKLNNSYISEGVIIINNDDLME